MNVITEKKTYGVMSIVAFVLLWGMSGCESDHGHEGGDAAGAPAGHDHSGHSHDAHEEGAESAGTWCFEHDVPEAECTKCSPSLIAGFKERNDWCAGHGLPESHCLLCNPELKAKWDAMRPGPAGGEATGADSDIAVERWREAIRPTNDPYCRVESNQIRLLNPSITEKAGIRVESARERHISADIECPAEVGYNETQLAHITPRAAGVIMEVPVDLGDQVEVGDVLAVIDSASLGRLKSEYIEARESHLIADADLDRHHPIHSAIHDMLKSCDGHISSSELREKYADTRIGDEKSRLLTAHAQLEYARQRYDREAKLAEKGISTQESLQSARSDLAKAEAEFAATHEAIDIEMEKEHLALQRAQRVAQVALDAARRALQIAGVNEAQIQALDEGKDQMLGRYDLRCPIRGTVVKRHAVVGELAETDAVVFSVADLSSMWLMLSLDERDLAVVKRGQPVVLMVDGLPGRSFRGELDWISSEVDVRTRTVQARVTLPNLDGMLRANMFGTARVVVRAEEESLMVSENAVQSDGCCSLVFVKESSTLYRPRKVALGLTRNGYVEVLEGLIAGEPVVTTGSFLMKTEILKGSIGAGCCEVDPGR